MTVQIIGHHSINMDYEIIMVLCLLGMSHEWCSTEKTPGKKFNEIKTICCVSL